MCFLQCSPAHARLQSMAVPQHSCTQMGRRRWPPPGGNQLNQIFEQFWRLFFSGRKFASFFCSFVAEFVCFCKSRPLKFMRPRSVSLTSTRFGMFRKKYQKSSKNLLKTCPKSRKNQRKIDKNENKSMEKAKMSEENQKMRYKYEKIRKKCQLEST